MASVGAETINGILIVKAYSMENYEAGRVTAELRRLRHYLTKMVKLDAAISPVTEFLLSVGLVVFILLANQAVESDRLDAGDLVILLGSLLMMMDPLRKLASVNNMIQTSVASAERVFEFIDMKSDIVEAEDAIDLPTLSEALRFENVRFAYNDDGEVLKGIDFEIKKGEMVALVGFSGAGKSTIVKLIPRFYDVSSGTVLVDGVDIRKATFRSLRDQIGIVTQDTILFNESIRDNIAFGQESYSPERVREAAVAAHAAEFIERLPRGYDTVIGESGGTLSGGQRQRLAIARAIIKDPAILILDEATSSLDSESEYAIQKAIEEFIVGRTTIVIAGRAVSPALRRAVRGVGRPGHVMRRLAVLILLAAVGCGQPETTPSAPPTSSVEPAPPSGPTAAAVDEAPPASSEGQVFAEVRIVDLEGRPLANMAAIASTSPNAFEPPVARGELSREDGTCTLSLPSDRRLYVRGWDPTLRMFTNNYYDVLPGEGTHTEMMTLVMVEGASLDAVIVNPDGQPAASTQVRIMLSHPSKGPWWPGEGKTNANGAVHFERLPAGTYVLKVSVPSGGQLEIPDVDLKPGGHTDLGQINLQ